MLERINAHTVFLGCNGVDPQNGITNLNLPEADIKRRMLRAARRRVIVADGSKIGEVALAHLCDIDNIDLLITDNSANPSVISALREHDLEVMIAR
jgi:DeoR family transcriptional regulator of aga operon